MVCKISFLSLFLLGAESVLKLQGSVALERKVIGGRWQLGFVSESLRLVRIPASISVSPNSVLQNIYPVLFVMELLVCDIFSSTLCFCLCLLKTFDCRLATYIILCFFYVLCWQFSSSAFPSSSYLNFHPCLPLQIFSALLCTIPCCVCSSGCCRMVVSGHLHRLSLTSLHPVVFLQNLQKCWWAGKLFCSGKGRTGKQTVFKADMEESHGDKSVQ